MWVRVLYFALVRERLGRSEEAIALPEGSTASDLLDALAGQNEALSGLRQSLRVAVNQAFVPLSHPLLPGDEVALIPPVAGGGPYCRLSSEPLSLREVIDQVSGPDRPDQGGVVTFSGVVRRSNQGRSVVRLEYEAYEAMAGRAMAALIQGIEAARPGVRVAIVHRTGALSVGDTAVVVAASAPHRAEAFAACREAIDRLKEEVPIWKKEISPDGEVWIGMHP